MDREAQDGHDRKRHYPPRWDTGPSHHGRQPERDHYGHSDPRIVADDEVVEKHGESSEWAHQVIGTGVVAAAGSRAYRRRVAATSANEVMSVRAIKTRIAASPPGQSAPAPSAPQNVP